MKFDEETKLQTCIWGGWGYLFRNF